MENNKIEIFGGVDSLAKHVSVLAVQTTNVHVTAELNKIGEELLLLDKALKRLRFDADFMDEADVNGFIDRLRHRD